MLSVRSIFGKKIFNYPAVNQSVKFFSHLSRIDKNHTFLHEVMENAPSLSEITSSIAKLGDNVTTKMLATINSKGLTPLEILKKNAHLSSKDKANLLFYCKNILAAEQNIKPINEPLTLEENNSEMFHLACQVANQTRHVIKASSTHPSVNALSVEEQLFIDEGVNVVRASIKNRLFRNKKLTYSEAVFAACHDIRSGNCEEYSYFFLEELKQSTHKELWAGLFYFKNGEHVFVVFDQKPLMDNINEYFIKESTAIFCDAWLGVAGEFNKDNILEKVKDYKYFALSNRSGFNLTVNFNPDFHQFEAKGICHILPNVNKKEIFPSVSFFPALKNNVAEERKGPLIKI